MARLGITPRAVRARFDELYQMVDRAQAEQPDLAGPTLSEAKNLGRRRSPEQSAFLGASAKLTLLERQFNEEAIERRGLSRRRLKAYLLQLDTIHGDVYFSKPWPFEA